VYRRVIKCEQYLHNFFGSAFEDNGWDSEGTGLKSSEGVRGQFIRAWEEDFVILSGGNPETEKLLRKMDIFSFLNRILALNKKQKAESSTLEHEPFGFK
jgi:hypothetical protein